MKLTYSVLRFVPDPAKAEAVNVGLLVGDESTGECRVMLDATSKRRAEALTTRRTVSAMWSYLGDLKVGLERHRAQWREFRFTDAWLRERRSDAANLLQFSPPIPIAERNLDAAIELLSRELLHQTAAHGRSPTFRKTALVAEVRRAYKAAGIELGSQLFERAVVQGSHHRETFDFAVANGRTVQLAHTWNFRQENLDLLSESVKAWAWTVRDIRSHGGRARAERKTLRVPRDVPISAIYAAPTRAEGRSVLDEALHAFRSVSAAAVPESRVEGVATRASELLG